MPNVVDATALMKALYFIFIFLKNMNAHTPTNTAKKVFESVTKKYQIFLWIFKDNQAQQITESVHKIMLTSVNIP